MVLQFPGVGGTSFMVILDMAFLIIFCVRMDIFVLSKALDANIIFDMQTWNSSDNRSSLIGTPMPWGQTFVDRASP